jgi:hypothetical protein
MTWWIDEYLDFSLRKLDLCPGADVSFSVKGESKSEDVDVSVFWHSPSVNVGWYPICQISRGDSTIFYGEGTENDEHWHDLLVRAADALAQELQATSTIS